MLDSFDGNKTSYLFKITTSGVLIKSGKYVIQVGMYDMVGELNYQKEYSATISFNAKAGLKYRDYGLRPDKNELLPIFKLFEITDYSSKEVGEAFLY